MSTSRSPLAPVNPTRQQLDDLDALLQRMLDLPVSRPDESAAPGARSESGAPTPAARPAKPPRIYSEPEALTDTPTQDASAAAPEFGPRVLAYPKGNPPASGPELDSEQHAAESRSEPSAGEDGENWVPFKSSWQPSSMTWQPLQENWKQIQETLRQRERQEEESNSAPQSDEQAPAAWQTPGPTTTPEAAAPPPLPPVIGRSPVLPLSEESSTEPMPLDWWVQPLLWFNSVFDWLLFPLGPLGKWLGRGTGRKVLGGIGLLCLAAAVGLAVADWIGWTS
jgi:hypothetical protein